VKNTAEAITARLLEVGDSLAFLMAIRSGGSTPDTLEWEDLRRQLADARVVDGDSNGD
jgi:hypothetical protein